MSLPLDVMFFSKIALAMFKKWNISGALCHLLIMDKHFIHSVFVNKEVEVAIAYFLIFLFAKHYLTNFFKFTRNASVSWNTSLYFCADKAWYCKTGKEHVYGWSTKRGTWLVDGKCRNNFM